MRRIAILAVILGGVADMVFTNVLGLPLALYVFSTNRLGRLPQDEVTAAYLAALHANPALYATAIGIGALASLLGGVVAAFVAKHDRVLGAALSSWACLLIDAVTIARHMSSDGLLLQIVLTPVAPLAAALGGYLVVKTRPRRAATVAAA